MTNIEKEINTLKALGANKYVMVKGLKQKAFSDNEIKEAMNLYCPQKTWNGNLIGIAIILLGLLLILMTQSTWGSWSLNKGLGSPKSWLLFQHWVVRPFSYLAFIFAGIGILINRGFINEKAKKLLLVCSFIGALLSLIFFSFIDLFVFILSIITITYIKIPINTDMSDIDILINSANNNIEEKEALKAINVKKWNGSVLGLAFLFCFVLFLNNPVHINGSANEHLLKFSFIHQWFVFATFIISLVIYFIRPRQIYILIYAFFLLCTLIFHLLFSGFQEVVIVDIICILLVTGVFFKNNE